MFPLRYIGLVLAAVFIWIRLAWKMAVAALVALGHDLTAALDELYATLLEEGSAEIEFAPELLGDGPMRHMMCAIPGGIRVEFIAAGC